MRFQVCLREEQNYLVEDELSKSIIPLQDTVVLDIFDSGTINSAQILEEQCYKLYAKWLQNTGFLF